MSNLILHRSESHAIALPEPRGGKISIRPATLADMPFMDALQKKHSKMVGFLHRPIFEKRIASGDVLIAEEVNEPRPLGSGLGVASGESAPLPDGRGSSTPVGYCMYGDKYLKRDELGIIYQLNIVPDKQRGLIGATLIKAAFDRAAYGCKLFCCWCAQDLQANYFWESLGFVPLAFRTGSRQAGSKKTPRIHIFWQRRIREGDDQTPFWFPSETQGGAVKEARLVLPIPPGTSWQDAKPAVLPGMENVNVLPPGTRDESGGVKKPRSEKSKDKAPAVPAKPRRGLWFAPPPPTKEELAAAKAEKSGGPKREKFKNDPKMVEAARELRDRYIEQINLGNLLRPSANGKYDVSRQLEAAPSAMNGAAMKIEAVPMLEAA